MTYNIKVRRVSRVPLRLGATNITNATGGTTVDLDDPKVERDMRFFRERYIVLGVTA